MQGEVQEQPVIRVIDSEVAATAVSNGLDNIKQIDCQVGGEVANGECPRHSSEASHGQAAAKAKRKARSTRRRLNAMISNASLHFSDTDSEGELTTPRVNIPNHAPTPMPPVVAAAIAANAVDGNLLRPVISVTLDGSDDSSYGGSDRRNSYVENLTDVDEIYPSDMENEAGKPLNGLTSVPRGSLTVNDTRSIQQGETDLEELSNEDDEESVQPPILVKPRSDILCDFNGETITTKEGDGPFSVEIRNQMSFDEPPGPSCNTPDILVMPTTDSEDMEASDDDEEEGACAQRSVYEDFDLIAASQIVMKNVDKMDQQLLSVKDPEDALSDSHTDIEDIE